MVNVSKQRSLIHVQQIPTGRFCFLIFVGPTSGREVAGHLDAQLPIVGFSCSVFVFQMEETK